jgi:phosphoglycerate dehydrogenase-like enzyme
MRVAVLDDYQDVALTLADWSPVQRLGRVDTFTDHLSDRERLVERLAPYDVVVLMRERTPVPADLIDRLPELRLIVTTGARNASIDVEAARRRGVVVSGTGSVGSATVELTWALILAASRHLVTETENVRAGRWQSTVGRDLAGRTLGVIGLGRLGSQVAAIGLAFGMEVLAWSKNLTPERAEQVGARAVSLHDLLAGSDVVTVHQVLSSRTQGLVGADELAMMRSGALLVNTSRGPIVDVDALVESLRAGHLGGAALDVFDEEPMPVDDPLRTTPGLLLTPHLGYVSEGVYRRFFGDAVEDIVAFAAGSPVRTL